MQFGQASIQLREISDGVDGIKQTLAAMLGIARRYTTNAAVYVAARQITQHLDQKDFYGEIEALSNWVRDEIRYTRDPLNAEAITTPDVLLRLRAGDCDDKSLLLGTMLASMGHPARFVAVGFRPGDYSHVFVQTKVGNGWVNLETTEPVAMGWGPKNVQSALTTATI